MPEFENEYEPEPYTVPDRPTCERCDVELMGDEIEAGRCRNCAMIDDNIIHLEFRSPHVEDDTMAFLSCKACKNKTYTLTQDKLDGFPLMRCAACGQHIGRMGWAHDDDPILQSQ